VAIKSLGINPMVMVWPVLVLAGFLSLGTVWMYEIAATWCRPSVERIVCESIEEIVYGILQKEHSIGGRQVPVFHHRETSGGPKAHSADDRAEGFIGAVPGSRFPPMRPNYGPTAPIPQDRCCG